jgi:hypothetical protein
LLDTLLNIRRLRQLFRFAYSLVMRCLRHNYSKFIPTKSYGKICFSETMENNPPNFGKQFISCLMAEQPVTHFLCASAHFKMHLPSPSQEPMQKLSSRAQSLLQSAKTGNAMHATNKNAQLTDFMYSTYSFL